MLDELSRKFLARVPVSAFDWQEISRYLRGGLNDNDDDAEAVLGFQRAILDATVFHELCLKFPPPHSYVCNFLKNIIRKVEEHNHEVDEKALQTYTDLISLNGTQESGYHTYIVDGSTTITVRESTHIISDGTTGLCTWQAAFYLAEWCLSNGHILSGKNILELGSGTGFLGLLLAKKLPLKSLILTDCHSKVLDTLQHNACINFIGDDRGTRPLIKHLDWLSFTDQDLGRPDVILASDVVYDTCIIPHLVTLLSKLLNSRRNVCGPAVAFIACTVRNEQTHQVLITQMEQQNLRWSHLALAPHIFICDRSLPVNIYQVSVT